MEFSETILRTDPRRFNPFREGNVLPKLRAGLTLTDDTLVVHAASAFYPLAASVMQSVYEPACFREETLRKVSTMEGFAALLSGASDILIATAPSDAQREALDRSGLPFRYVTLCLEPLVFLANRANPADGLRADQVRDMYVGALENWHEVGGKDLPVTTYRLERNNGSQSAFEQIVKNDPVDSRHIVVRTMPEIVDAVARDESGLCYAFWSYYTKMYANRLTKMLNIDDRGPTADDYPFRYPVYLICRADSGKASVTELIRWTQTDEGRELIRRGNLCWRSIGS